MIQDCGSIKRRHEGWSRLDDGRSVSFSLDDLVYFIVTSIQCQVVKSCKFRLRKLFIHPWLVVDRIPLSVRILLYQLSLMSQLNIWSHAV